MANLVLNTKTYTGPALDNAGRKTWWERSLGVAALFGRIVGRIVISDAARVKWTLNQPLPQPEGGAVCCGPQDVRQNFVGINATFDPSSTVAERTDTLRRLQALVLTTQFEGSFINLDVAD